MIMEILLGMHVKVSKGAKIRNRYNQAPHLTQDTNKSYITNLASPTLLTLCMLADFSCIYCRLLTFFKLFLDNFSRTLSDCQTFLDPDQDQQNSLQEYLVMTKVANSKEKN